MDTLIFTVIMVLKSLINIYIIFISNFIQLLPLLHCTPLRLCQVEPLAVTEPSSISRNSIPNLDKNF